MNSTVIGVPAFGAWRARRRDFGRRWRAALPALVALALGACANQLDPSRSAFVAVSQEEFGAGYSHIVERYVEPVSIGDLAVAGMERIERIDPKLNVTRDGGRLHLSYSGGGARDVPAPRRDDAASWATATSLVLDNARQMSPALHDADLETIYDAVFTGALKGLDPFSRYSTAAAAREQRAQRDGFGGVGLTLKQDGKEIHIVSVLEDAPSQRMGIQPDDVIVQVNGESLDELSLGDVIERLRGPVGSQVRLLIANAKDRRTREFVLRRALIVPPTVTYARHGDVAYIKLSSFNTRTTTNLERVLRQAMREMGKELRGVVIDLRDNPGGLLDQAITVSDLFLQDGRILSTSGRHPDSNQSYEAAGTDLLHGLPIAILVNHGTASAAEVVAAALQDHGRAVVIGTTSYGKGTVQTVHRLPNEGEIIITWSRIHAPSGYILNEVGVIPTVCTSKVALEGPEAVAAVIDGIRSGHSDTAAARLALHGNGQPNKVEMRLLRASCPSRSGESELDIEIAQKIIDDGSLLARALQSSVPEIAKSE